MKIKKIMDLCVKSKIIQLYTDVNTGTQWLSDSRAIYPLEGVPRVDIFGLCTMYDINEKKRDKMHLSAHDELPVSLNLSDCADNETPAEILDVTINADGFAYVPFKTEEGLMYIDGKYLSPLSDSDNYSLLYFIRNSANDIPYIVVKQGLILVAAICTIKPTEYFVNRLGNIYHSSLVALENAKENTEAIRS